MTSNLAELDSQSRGARVFGILANFVTRLERQKRPHPEVLEMTSFAVDRFMEFAYESGALETCLEATKLGMVVTELLQDATSAEDGKARLTASWASLEREFQKELARLQPANGGAAKVATPGRAVAAPAGNAPASQSIPTDGALPQDSGDGSFDYLGTAGFPFDAELTSIFLTEAGEQLPAVEKLLLTMESYPESREGINELFRLLHTIKGNSGFLGLREFIRLVHAMEQYLEPFRNRTAARDAFYPQILLEGCDALKALLDNLQCRVEVLTSSTGDAKFHAVPWEALTGRILTAVPQV